MRSTPIAGYETELGLYGFRELIARGAVDIVQPDLAWTGGLSEGKRIAAFAQAHHRMVAPHSFGSAVLLVASLHYAASIPNALILEWDQNPNGLRSELLKEELRLEGDSTVRVPERPGLGIELDRGAIDRYRVG
jgi:L-alanine-DL-glutamate epimerase-like enolase superfamily enzyme